MDLNKTTQDLKVEVGTIKESQRETTLEIETLGKKSGTIDASIINRIQEMEERISGAEDSIENRDTGNLTPPGPAAGNHRCEHQQQNTRDGRENLRCRRFHRDHGHNNQRKCKMQKDPNSKHPGNPGHSEETKPKDNRYR